MIDQRINRKLFLKYLLLILLPITITLLVSNAISIYFSYLETKSSLASLQHEKARALASRIEQYIRQIQLRLIHASETPSYDDVEVRRIAFLTLMRRAPEVTDVAYLEQTGRERIGISSTGIYQPQMDHLQEAFRYAKPGQPWFGPVYFRRETEPFMTIAIRTGGGNGPVTVAEVNLKLIWEMVSRIKIGDTGKAYVLDGSGLLVADRDIGQVLRKTRLSDLAHVKAAADAQQSDELAMLSRGLAGNPVLASHARIEGLDWKVFVEQPMAEIYAQLAPSVLRAGLLLIAGFVIATLGALALARRHRHSR